MAKRIECERKWTGRTREKKYFFGLVTAIQHEYSVLTCLLSMDVTDEWHKEWKVMDWWLA